MFLVFLVVVPELCTSLPILRLPSRSAPPFALVSPCPCAKFDLLLLLFPLKKFFFLFVVVVDNKPGVLDSITGVFARRGYNIQSLGVGPEATFDISRISTVVPGTQEDIRMLLKQILKVPYVISADDITKTPYVERELMLIKIVCDRKQRGELVDLCAIFRAKIVDVSENTATIEVGGRQKKITSIQRLLEPYGILEVARSGRVALPRDSGVDSKLLTAIENEGDLQW